MPSKQHEINDAVQDRLFVSFIFVSIACHILAFILHQWTLFSAPKPLIQEWSIDTDLIVDAEKAGGAPIPPAERELLPQLPKNFTVKDPERPDENPAEEKKDVPPPKEEEVKKGETPNDEKDKVDPTLKNNRPDATELKMQDALKRLALERLRDEQTKHKDDPLKKISAELAKGQGVGRGDGPGGITAIDKYQQILKKIISRNYNLPPTYDMKTGTLTVTLGITLDGRGELRSVEILESSGDSVFDEYTIKAAKSGAPYPPPPKEIVGQLNMLKFRK
jgi:TonB family protein